MPKLILEIPQDTCKECPYLKTEILDYNYYGEKTERPICSVFGCIIKDCNPCDACKINCQETEDDIRKYADFLVREINRVPDEAYIKAIDDFAALIKPSVNRPAIIDDMAEYLKQKRLM